MVSMTRAIVRAVQDWPRAVRLLLIVTMGSLLVLGAAVTGTVKAYAATDVRTPLAAGPTIASPFAVFGTTVVLGAYRSTNTGGGWAPDATLSSAVWRYAGESKLVGYTNTGSTYSATVFTPSSGASSPPYPLPASPVSMNATWSLSYGSSGSYTAHNFVSPGTDATPTSPSPAAGQTAQITPSGAVLWSNTSGTFAVAATPSATAGAWVSIPGVRDFLATQDKLLYVMYDANKVSICSRPLSSLSSAPTCAVAMSGVDYSDPNLADFTLLSFGSLTVMTATLASGSSLLPAYVWSGSGAAAQIQLPTGSSIDQPEAVPMPRLYGDSAYVVVRDADTVGSIKKVNADGTLSAGFSPPNTYTAITSLAVAPDRVVAADARDASTLNASWSRAVSGAGFGTLTPLPSRASWLDASAGRTAVSGPIGLLLFDRGTLTHVFTDASFTSMSGPYVTQQIDDTSGAGVTKISTADGAAVATFPGWSGLLFGSQYVTQTKGDAGSGPVSLTVNSLTGGTAAKQITLPAETAPCWASSVWGDNVALSCGTSIQVYSLRTGGYVASYAGPANTYVALAAFGDGYAVIRQGTVTTTNLLWNLSSSTTTALPCSGWGPIATDGEGHLACTSDTELIWRDFSALSTAAPRVLGMLAPASVNFTTTLAWTTQIDATKPLAAGSLVIKKADGTVIRTLPTPATTDGSLRITWDGRDMYGDPAPAGTYTYIVAADAADGTGTVASVTGTGAPTATVAITANVSPDYTKFVQASYQDFLGRAPSQNELTFQTSALSTNMVTKSGYLLTLANSDEWLNAIVTKMYTDTLGRTPDAAGLAYWKGLIRNKTFSVADVASRFYASDEYYLYHAGGTPTSWVTSLYTKLLSRSPDAAGLQYWVGLTNQKGYGRDKVAYDLYQSTESRMLRVTALYQTLLKRDPDATGLPYWTAQVLTTGDIVLAMNLADSQEYWLRARARF